MNVHTQRSVMLDGLVFPEAPRWHDGRSWLVDVHAHCAMTIDSAGVMTVIARFDDKPSGLGFLPDGTPLAALMRGRRIVNFEGGKVATHADLGSLPWHELNDMVVAADGNLYVGTKAPNPGPGAPTPGSDLILVRPDGSFISVASELYVPNGIVITPDGKTLIIAETRANRLTAFTIAGDGTLHDRRIFADLDCSPDGICLDAEGCVWVGTVWGNAFIRVAEGGEVRDRIELEDGKWAVACMLGGADRRTLYLLTAHQSLENLRRLTDFEADLGSESRGFVESVRVAVPGAGWP